MFFSHQFGSTGASNPQIVFLSSLTSPTDLSRSSSSSSSAAHHGHNHHHHYHHYLHSPQMMPLSVNTRSSDPLADIESQILRHLYLQHNALSTTTAGWNEDGYDPRSAAAAYLAHRNLTRQNPRNVRRTKDHSTSRKMVSQLPIFLCDSNDPYQHRFGDAKKECAVCLSESEDGETLVLLPCQHYFHPDCIKPWLKDHNSCPTCRFELPMADEEQEEERAVRMNDQYGRKALKLMSVSSEIQYLYSELQKWGLSSKRSFPTNSPTGSSKLKSSSASNRIEELPKRSNKIISLLNAREKKLQQLGQSLMKIKIPAPTSAETASSSAGNNQHKEKIYAWDNHRLRQLRDQCSERIQMIQGMIDSLREAQLSSKKHCCTIC